MMTNSRTEDEYALFAPYYDALLEPFLRPIRERVCRIAQREHLGRMIDICCGTGRQAIMLDRLGIHVTGVDLSPAMLSAARSKSPPSIHYYEEDASQLHFANGSFNGAIISFALHEKKDYIRRKILAEAQRVLREDGRLIIVDFLKPRSLSSWMSTAFVNVIERLAGARHHEEYRKYMKKGGLEAILEEHNLFLMQLEKFHFGSVGLAVLRFGSRP